MVRALADIAVEMTWYPDRKRWMLRVRRGPLTIAWRWLETPASIGPDEARLLFLAVEREVESWLPF